MVVGRADYLKIGAWNAVCDRCGEKSKNGKLMRTWDNFWVHAECFERRHPSDFLRGFEDDPSTPWNRPEAADTAAVDIEGNTSTFLDGPIEVGDVDKTLITGTDATIQDWNVALTANRTVTLSTSNARVDNRFTVHRTGGGAFTLDVGGLQTIPASIVATVVVKFNGITWLLESYTPSGL